MRPISLSVIPLRLKGVLIVALAMLTSGCDVLDNLGRSDEDRINAAVPVSELVLIAKASLSGQSNDAQRKTLEEHYQQQLKLRALSCANGYAPSWYSSVARVRENLTDTACFTRFDQGLVRGLNLRKIGLLLKKPPLRPKVTNGPQFYSVDGRIGQVAFAEQAGVAVLQAGRNLLVLDLVNGKSEKAEGVVVAEIGRLSANGRLHTLGQGERVTVRDTESGATLLDLPGVRMAEFRWLKDSAAAYVRADGRKTMILDFEQGKETPSEIGLDGTWMLEPVPGAALQFVQVLPGALRKLALSRQNGELRLQQVGEKLSRDLGGPGLYNGVTPDGQTLFSANRQINLVSVESLKLEQIGMEPITVQSAVATADPAALIINAYLHLPRNGGPRSYLFNIPDRTLSPLDPSDPGQERLMYAPPLGRNVRVRNEQLMVIDKLPAGAERPLAEVTAELQMQLNQYKLEQATQQALNEGAALVDRNGHVVGNSRGMVAGGTWNAPGTPDERRAAAIMAAQTAARTEASMGMGKERNQPLPGAAPLLGDVARHAQVEAIGVHSGGHDPKASGAGRRVGLVEVTVRKSVKPVVLVLSASEPTKWVIEQEPGSKLVAVLVSSLQYSPVFGNGQARVIVVGDRAVFKRGTEPYNVLEREVRRWTGKGIDIFQGAMQAGQFVAGG